VDFIGNSWTDFQSTSSIMDPLDTDHTYARIPGTRSTRARQSRRESAAAGHQEEYIQQDSIGDHTHGQPYDAAFPERYPEQEEYLPLHGEAPFDVGPFLGDDLFLPISPPAGPSQSRTASSLGGAAISEELLAAAIEEDKRRRNTAASARFRMKKKEREAELERRAKEMTDRCEELQKRIGVLETENRWLRELITERGKNRTDKDDEPEKSGRRRRSGS
jgi:hypothetical protein